VYLLSTRALAKSSKENKTLMSVQDALNQLSGAEKQIMQWNVNAIPITTLAQFNQHLSQFRAGQAERNRQFVLSSTPNPAR
jgi:hypothetical protein